MDQRENSILPQLLPTQQNAELSSQKELRSSLSKARNSVAICASLLHYLRNTIMPEPTELLLEGPQRPAENCSWALARMPQHMPYDATTTCKLLSSQFFCALETVEHPLRLAHPASKG